MSGKMDTAGGTNILQQSRCWQCHEVHKTKKNQF